MQMLTSFFTNAVWNLWKVQGLISSTNSPYCF
uniref:Uncharacterized protein n=1 Tax=Anguilla anguilla TaxID=7936 RepID=A0A0E9V6U9_ANGAN